MSPNFTILTSYRFMVQGNMDLFIHLLHACSLSICFAPGIVMWAGNTIGDKTEMTDIPELGILGSVDSCFYIIVSSLSLPRHHPLHISALPASLTKGPKLHMMPQEWYDPESLRQDNTLLCSGHWTPIKAALLPTHQTLQTTRENSLEQQLRVLRKVFYTNYQLHGRPKWLSDHVSTATG